MDKLAGAMDGVEASLGFPFWCFFPLQRACTFVDENAWNVQKEQTRTISGMASSASYHFSQAWKVLQTYVRLYMDGQINAVDCK